MDLANPERDSAGDAFVPSPLSKSDPDQGPGLVQCEQGRLPPHYPCVNASDYAKSNEPDDDDERRHPDDEAGDLPLVGSDFDADSMDVQSRTDDSLGSALDYHPAFGAGLTGRRVHRPRVPDSHQKMKATPENKDINRNLRSRGRARKPNEPEPFLCIDNLPRQGRPSTRETQRSELPLGVGAPAKQVPKVPSNTPAPGTASATSYRDQLMSVSSSQWNAMVPRRHKAAVQAVKSVSFNCHVKSPFKHTVGAHTAQTAKQETSSVQPDQQLKESTAQATYQVAKALATQRQPQERIVSGRLLKAKLKPMYPVRLDGPGMHQCRGIVAGATQRSLYREKRTDQETCFHLDETVHPGPEWQPWAAYLDEGTRSHLPSASRTLQRRRYIMSNVGKEYPTERPHTSESIHHTSIASDITENREQELHEYLRGHVDYLSIENEHAATSSEDREVVSNDSIGLSGLRMPPNSLASINGQTGMNTCEDERGNLAPAEEEHFAGQHVKSVHNFEAISEVTEKSYSADDRPSSVQEPGMRKSVRFAESGALADASRLSHSALPRLSSDKGTGSSQNSVKGESKRKPKEGCKPYDFEKQGPGRNPDDGDGGGFGDPQQRPTPDRGSAAQGASSHGKQNTGKTSPGTGGRQQPLALPVNDIMEAMFDPTIGGQRPAPHVTRPRSRQGPWEDLAKPDDDLERLVMNSSGDFQTNDDQEKRSRAARVVHRVDGMLTTRRPASAKGPGENRRRTATRHPRPSSAVVSTGRQCFQAGPALRMKQVHLSERTDEVAGNQSVRASSVSKPSRKTYRPLSGRRPFSAPARRVGRPVSAKQRRVGSTTGCVYCGETTQNVIGLDKDQSFAVCNACTDEGRWKPDGVTVDYQEKVPERQLADGTSVAVTVETDRSEQLWTNLDHIEKSLDAVQLEIKECIQQSTSQAQEAKAKCATTPGDGDGDGNGPNAAAAGWFSSHLVGDEASRSRTHPMKVYHYDREANQHPTIDVPAAENLLEDGEQHGAISSYDVTMVTEATPLPELSLMRQAWSGAPAGNFQLPIRDDRSNLRNKDDRSLEVKASQVPLNMPNTARHTPSQPGPIAAYPPVCFRVNARPPHGFLYYFAYGMDMNPDRFSTQIGRETQERLWGLLYGFKLLFNKKGTGEDPEAFPNLEFEPQSSVEGCLYLISQQELDRLDASSGYPQHYEHLVLPVWLLNCTEPDDLGVAQYCVAALMYIARDSCTNTGGMKLDNTFAVDQCLKGADLLSVAYKQSLLDVMGST